MLELIHLGEPYRGGGLGSEPLGPADEAELLRRGRLDRH